MRRRSHRAARQGARLHDALGIGPGIRSGVRLIDRPRGGTGERAANEKRERLLLGCIADIRTAAETLIARAAMARTRQPDWLIEARAALDHRPAAWANVVAKSAGRLHPAEVFRTLRPYIERNADTVLICDGGEFAQWGQSMLPVRRRLVNGVPAPSGPHFPSPFPRVSLSLRPPCLQSSVTVRWVPPCRI